MPADRCQIHHADKDWADGGETNIDELTLACDSDHTSINDTPLGWKTEIGGDPTHPGRCAWTPPAHLNQPPAINHQHHPHELLTGDRGNNNDNPP